MTVTQHLGSRILALVLAALSTASMLYIGLYQTRWIQHMWCPLFKEGCEAVADSTVAHPFGIPDGYIAAGIYGLSFFLLLFAPMQRMAVWVIVLVLVGFATVAGIFGIRDMFRMGQFCFFCIITTAMSPVLFWAAWRLK